MRHGKAIARRYAMAAIKYIEATTQRDEFHLHGYSLQSGDHDGKWPRRLWELAWDGEHWYVPGAQLTLKAAHHFLPILRLLRGCVPTHALDLLAQRGYFVEIKRIEAALRHHLSRHLLEPMPAWMEQQAAEARRREARVKAAQEELRAAKAEPFLHPFAPRRPRLQAQVVLSAS